MRFVVCASTDKGCVRRVNQDRMLAERIETPLGQMAFAVLCDGMGGLDRGEEASEALVLGFAGWLDGLREERDEEAVADHVIRRQWTGIVERVNAKLLAYGREIGCRMGTTVTAMLITQKRYYLMSIGDTRAYEAAAWGMRQLTVDHTLIQREVERGNLTREQAENAPMNHVLTRCVGMNPEVYPDMFFGNTRKGAVYLLCSDGFRHRVSETEMAETLCKRDGGSMEKRQRNLIELGKQRGETDNISVITVQCVGSLKGV